jgi:WXG100 family type VII secretion target
MRNIIDFTPDELRQKALRLNTNNTIVQSEIKEINAIISRLRSTFLGETASVFFREFDVSINSLAELDDMVRSLSVEIRNAANKLEAMKE